MLILQEGIIYTSKEIDTNLLISKRFKGQKSLTFLRTGPKSLILNLNLRFELFVKDY